MNVLSRIAGALAEGIGERGRGVAPGGGLLGVEDGRPGREIFNFDGRTR